MRRAPLESRLAIITFVVGLATLRSSVAFADEPPKDEPAPATDVAAATAPTPSSDVKPPESPHRAASVEPKPAEAPSTDARARFDADPVADGAIIAVSAGFAGVLDLVNSTGEVRPQQISPNFDRSKLLGIDRGALSQNPDSDAGNYSNWGLYAAVGFSLVDPVLSGFRERSVQTGLVDGIMYAESVTLAWGFTNLTKIAVRRPRPLAYIDAEKHRGDPNYSNADTDSSLSFISGHAAVVSAISATATYLAFARSPRSARPWITLLVGTALTTFVCVERVFSAKHFPTDVIAGAVAGAGIGVLVPHLHRSEDLKQRRLWVGFAPAERGQGGAVQIGGLL